MPILHLAPQVQDIIKAFENTLEWCNKIEKEIADSFQGFLNIKRQIAALFCHVEQFNIKFQAQFKSLQTRFQKSEASEKELENYIASAFQPQWPEEIRWREGKRTWTAFILAENIRNIHLPETSCDFNRLLVRLLWTASDFSDPCLPRGYGGVQQRTEKFCSRICWLHWMVWPDRENKFNAWQTQFVDFFKTYSDKKDLAFAMIEQVDHHLTSPTIFLCKNNSDPVEFVPPSKPGRPTVLSRSHDQIELKWTPPENSVESILHYRIASWSTLNPSKTFQTGDSTPRKQITGLSANTEYKFTVQAVCEVGCSAKSDVCCEKTDYGPWTKYFFNMK